MSSPRPSVASQIVRFCSVQSSQRETLSARRARALRPAGRRYLLLALSADPLEQRDVYLLAAAEVVATAAA
jgi:hypothetical protein